MAVTRPLRSLLTPEDLLVLLAVARTGTVTAAAIQLRLDHSTVSRRVARLEKQVKRRLFDRSSCGWRLTEAGQQLRGFAEEIHETLTQAGQALTEGGAGEINGTVRLMTPDGFGTYLAPEALAQATARHRGLKIEILTCTQQLDLASGEFDLAVALESARFRSSLAQQLCTYSLRLFASADYLNDNAPIAAVRDLRQHRVVYYLDSFLDIPTLRVLDEIVPGKSACLQSNSVAAQVQAVLAGHGIGLLPGYVSGFHPELVPVLSTEIDVPQAYWIITPTAFARAGHVRITARYLLEHLSGHVGSRPLPQLYAGH